MLNDGIRPQQFSVIDLFAIMTLAALVSAMMAPLLREIRTEDRSRLLVGAIFQLGIAAGATALAIARRRKLLEKAGQRIGIAFCGQLRWRLWPVIKCLMYMLFLAIAQICLALLAVELATEGPFVWLYQFQLGCIAGLAFARFLWRVYPNSIEFFDHGITLGGVVFIPWAQVELRPSQYFADRLVVVLRPAVSSVVGDTKLAQVSDALRERLLSTQLRAE